MSEEIYETTPSTYYEKRLKEELILKDSENARLREELADMQGLGDGEMTYREKADSYREELNERCREVARLRAELQKCYAKLGDYKFNLRCLDNKCARLAALVPHEPEHVAVEREE